MKEKIEIIDRVFTLIDIKRRVEIFYSDYTFSKVEESKMIKWIGGILDNNILDDLNHNYFITIIAEASYGSIRVEINPPQARKNVFNCSHIDISLENDFLLYNILSEDNKVNLLIDYFDTLDGISEFYFVDLNKSPNCYSDMLCRIFSKEYDEFEFSNLLLKDHSFENKLYEKTVKVMGYNFTSQIFRKENFPLIEELISQNNLNITCSVGSLTFYGEDIFLFINLVRKKLDNYIIEINKKNIYQNEFNRVFKKKS
ncbi:MAG: hypothetical protein AAGU10_15220 [Methanosarcina mazei]